MRKISILIIVIVNLGIMIAIATILLILPYSHTKYYITFNGDNGIIE